MRLPHDQIDAGYIAGAGTLKLKQQLVTQSTIRWHWRGNGTVCVASR
jgi:hypothetical protein